MSASLSVTVAGAWMMLLAKQTTIIAVSSQYVVTTNKSETNFLLHQTQSSR